MGVLVALTLGGCSTIPSDRVATTTATSATHPVSVTSMPVDETPRTSTTTEAPVPDPDYTGTAVRLVIGGTAVAATLDDNPSARGLLAQLPLTLTLRDYNGVEKTAKLTAPLTVEGAPRGSDPAPFDIGYYAPDQVLVLYYRDVGFFDGIVALGRFDPAAADLVEEQPDDAAITIARA